MKSFGVVRKGVSGGTSVNRSVGSPRTRSVVGVRGPGVSVFGLPVLIGVKCLVFRSNVVLIGAKFHVLLSNVVLMGLQIYGK